MKGQDFKKDQQAWEETSKFSDIEQKRWTKIVQIIHDETAKVLNWQKFLLTAKGVFGQLIRIQLINNQIHVVAAKEKIHKTLKQITSTTPSDMEQLRTQELLMRNLVELDERSRYEPKGSKKDLWCKEMIQHLQKANLMDDYPNHATTWRANVIDELKYILRDQSNTPALITPTEDSICRGKWWRWGGFWWDSEGIIWSANNACVSCADPSAAQRKNRTRSNHLLAKARRLEEGLGSLVWAGRAGSNTQLKANRDHYKKLRKEAFHQQTWMI
jgi:hypothetical protein